MLSSNAGAARNWYSVNGRASVLRSTVRWVIEGMMRFRDGFGIGDGCREKMSSRMRDSKNDGFDDGGVYIYV